MNLISITNLMIHRDNLDFITEDQILGGLALDFGYYNHFLNLTLSPMAVAMSIFNYDLVNGKYEKNYSKDSIPKAAYIFFTGYFSEITVEMITQYSKNVLLIIIYDESTGGPRISQNPYNNKYLGIRGQEKSPHSEVLYIPLCCASNGKSYDSEDLNKLFELMVYPALIKTKPDYIILEHSFSFKKNSKTPFTLNAKGFARIVENLNKLADSKLILHPFQPPPKSNIDKLNLRNQYSNYIINLLKEELKPVAYGEFELNKEKYEEMSKTELEVEFTNFVSDRAIDYIIKFEEYLNIMDKYSEPLNKNYFLKLTTAAIETMAKMRHSSERYYQRYSESTLNPLLALSISNIQKYYKNHSKFADYFSVNAEWIVMAQQEFFKKALQKNLVENLLSTIEDFNITSYTLAIDFLRGDYRKSIPFLVNESRIGYLNLTDIILDNKQKVDLVFDSYSSYKIVYEEPLNMLFILNCIISNKRDGTYRNFILFFDEQGQVSSAREIGYPFTVKGQILKSSGIGYNNKNFYLCYGTIVRSNMMRDTDSIYVYDLEKKSWTDLKLERVERRFPKHSVTCCAFDYNHSGKVYNMLVIVGGKNLDEQLKFDETDRAERFEETNALYHDRVECFYKEEKSNSWKLYVVAKINLETFVEQILVLSNGYLFFDQNSSSLLLVGGKSLTYSVTNFHVYTQIIKIERPDHFEIKMRKMVKREYNKNEIETKLRINMLEDMVPVADHDKNFIFKGADQEITIIHREKNSYYKTIITNVNVPGSENIITEVLTRNGNDFIKNKFEDNLLEKNFDFKYSISGLAYLRYIWQRDPKFVSDVFNPNILKEQIKRNYSGPFYEKFFTIIDNHSEFQDLFSRNEKRQVLGSYISALNNTHEFSPGKTILESLEKYDLTEKYPTFNIPADLEKNIQQYEGLKQNTLEHSIKKLNLGNIKTYETRRMDQISEGATTNSTAIERFQIRYPDSDPPQSNPSFGHSEREEKELNDEINDEINFYEIDEQDLNISKNILLSSKSGIDKRLDYCLSNTKNSIIIRDNDGSIKTLFLRIEIDGQSVALNGEVESYSISIFRKVVYVYFSPYLQNSNFILANKLSNWIFVGDINAALNKYQERERYNPIYLHRLHKVINQNELVQRSIIATYDNIFLFGGKRYNSESDDFVLLSEKILCIRIDYTNQRLTESEVNLDLPEKSAEICLEHDEKNIYACPSRNPNNLMIHNKLTGKLKKVVKLKEKIPLGENTIVQISSCSNVNSEGLLISTYEDTIDSIQSPEYQFFFVDTKTFKISPLDSNDGFMLHSGNEFLIKKSEKIDLNEIKFLNNHQGKFIETEMKLIGNT